VEDSWTGTLASCGTSSPLVVFHTCNATAVSCPLIYILVAVRPCPPSQILVFMTTLGVIPSIPLLQPTMESTSIIVSLFFASSALAHPLNTTEVPSTSSTANITLPAGSTNHGDPHLLCTPASWFTVASFILANFVAHSATTPIYPGEQTFEKALAFVTSFLFPAAGVGRGLNTIARGIMVLATPEKSELQQAAAAGALCMVIRTSEWTPAPGTGSVVHGTTRQRFVNKQFLEIN